VRNSTLGFERRTDPLFNLDEESFVKEILRTVPPMPSYYPRMKELNARGAAAAASVPGVRPFTPEELDNLRKEDDVTILDLRGPEAFGGAHIAGAINIGAGQNLSLWAGWLLDAESCIVVVNDKGDDVESRKALVRVGLDHLVGYLAGGMPAWIDAGLPFSRTTQLATGEVDQCSEAAFVLDVRSDEEWKSGHIEGAQHIMLGDLPRKLSNLPKGRSIITVCGSGYRSSIAASLLERSGIRDVSSMDGGMAAWAHQRRVTSGGSR